MASGFCLPIQGIAEAQIQGIADFVCQWPSIDFTTRDIHY